MPSPIVHAGTAMLCTHGGTAALVSTGGRVLVDGQRVVTSSSVCVVAGCASSPQPCATGRWLAGASRVLVNGEPVVTLDSPSVCEPGGGPIVVVAGAAAGRSSPSDQRERPQLLGARQGAKRLVLLRDPAG